MTCATIRNNLITSEHPDHPGPDESRHLADCPACHAWLRRLVQLERQIPKLPLPECAPPSKLLDRIQQSAPTPLVRLAPLPSTQTERVREFGRQKLALACSLAATLALFTLAWWAWPPQPRVNPVGIGVANDPYTVLRDRMFKDAHTPKDRLHAVVQGAEDFLEDAKQRGDDPRRVEQVAIYFERLVQEELPQQARALSANQREAVLPALADRFRAVNSAAERVASAWENQHPDSARYLKEIARNADHADRLLRNLAQTRG
jgi:hypothetical protein